MMTSPSEIVVEVNGKSYAVTEVYADGRISFFCNSNKYEEEPVEKLRDFFISGRCVGFNMWLEAQESVDEEGSLDAFDVVEDTKTTTESTEEDRTCPPHHSQKQWDYLRKIFPNKSDEELSFLF